MGSIYKRGNVYWIKYYRSGKPYRESTKSKKEADAKRLLKKREGEIAFCSLGLLGASDLRGSSMTDVARNK